MVERWQWMTAAGVALGHGVLLWWLAHAMVPPVPAPAPEQVLLVDWWPPEPEPPPEPEFEPDPEPESARELRAEPAPEPERAALARERPRSPAPPPPMQAVFESGPAPEPATGRIDPARDPFRPPPPAATGFGRRDQPALPAPSRPRIAGEGRPNAPLRGLRHNESWSPQQWAQAVGSLIGGGPNALPEAPCGGRLNGAGVSMAESFSPKWQKHYGCDPAGDGLEYDGRVELPPGTAR